METSLQTMIAGFRNGLRGGSTAVAVLGEIPQSLQTGVGALAAQAQIDVAAADSRVGVCFTGDISLADSVHYDPAGAREFGRRMAEVAAEVADFGPVRGSQPYRMKYDATKGRFADAFGSDARIFDEVTVDSVTLPDSTTGTVLHIDREGVDTSMVFPGGDEYTIACWCQRKVSPTGNNPNAGGGSGDDTEDFFVAGRLDGQSIGNIFSRRFGAHVETGTASPTNVDLGNSGTVGSTAANAVLAVDAWFHVAITFSGGQFQKYVNGATAGSAAGSSYPDSTGPHFVQIGAWGDLTGVNGIPDMYFHDIVILPYALSAAQIATLDSDGVLPS